MTRIQWGYSAENFRTANRTPIFSDFSELVNPHMAICGDTGTGKTHTLRLAISQVINNAKKSGVKPPRFHLFDVHDDIQIDNSSDIVFSETSPYGFNPLWINPDPHTGGVRKCIQQFISTLSLSPTHGRALGPKQQDVLRNLLLDVFEMHGYYADDPSSWKPVDEKQPSTLIPNRVYLNIPFSEKDLAKNAARAHGISIEFDKENKLWHVDSYRDAIQQWPVKQWGKSIPTLNTLCRYATRRREMSFTGLGLKEAKLLNVVHRKSRALSRALQNFARSKNNTGFDSSDSLDSKEALEKAKDAYQEAFSAYVSSIEHGNALASLLKYDSFDSLSTVKQIIDSLNSSGIFRDTPPNFDEKKEVWRYKLKALRTEEQKFLVNVRLKELFAKAVEQGDSNGELRHVIVIDEGAKFVEKEDDHILNVIALEARKFGLAIWFASQSPTHYPDNLMTSMGTKIILGLDSGYWKQAQNQLKLDESLLKWIRPREGILLKQKLKGVSDQPWQRVISASVLPKSN